MKVAKHNENLTFNGLSSVKAPLGVFYNANSIIPTLLIESGVTLGRAYEANKRGGKKEATERIVEQGSSALIWVFGVQILKKIGDFIGTNFLNIENLNFDIGKDSLRNPLKNNNISKKALSFKVGNILTSTFLATYFIGFILPKITHKISSKVKNNKAEGKKEENNNPSTLETINFKDFKNQLKNNEVSFGSLLDKVTSLSYALENDATKRLLITDTGVILGRYKNARNKYEKIENLFRDISSIYFYLFCSNHIVKLLDKVTKNTNINPDVVNETVKMIKEELNQESLTCEEFTKKMLGRKETKQAAEDMLKVHFNDKEIYTYEEFVKIFPYHQYKAQKMVNLQPIFDGNGVLSRMQIKDILNDGLTSNPKFLKKAMSAATKGKSDDKYKFVSKKFLEKTRQSIDEFIVQINEYALKTNKPITIDLVEKAANKNMIKNFAFNSIGLLVSAFALGIIIPKIQYFITKKLTNKNEFVGDMKAKEKKN